MGDTSFWECPNCGSTDLVEITPNKRRCAYCGTILTSYETRPDLVKCPRCGFDNERGDRYCNNCGAVLAGWVAVEMMKKTDPAIISIVATVAGLVVFPIGGAILGLVLGYRALRQARAGGKGAGSERLARTAIIVGWIGIALNVLPLFMILGVSGVQAACSLCDGLFEMLSDALTKIRR